MSKNGWTSNLQPARRLTVLCLFAALTACVNTDAGEIPTGINPGGAPSSATDVAAVVAMSPEGTLASGERLQLSATARDANGNVLPRTITWTSSTQSIALVSGGGLVTAVAPGTVTITASSEGKAAPLQLFVIDPPPGSR